MPTGIGTMGMLALGAVGSTVLSQMMAPDKPEAQAAQAAPTVTPPTPMPDEKATRTAAMRSSIAEQARRRGRASTILTDQSAMVADPLGGA